MSQRQRKKILCGATSYPKVESLDRFDCRISWRLTWIINDASPLTVRFIGCVETDVQAILNLQWSSVSRSVGQHLAYQLILLQQRSTDAGD